MISIFKVRLIGTLAVILFLCVLAGCGFYGQQELSMSSNMGNSYFALDQEVVLNDSSSTVVRALKTPIIGPLLKYFDESGDKLYKNSVQTFKLSGGPHGGEITLFPHESKLIAVLDLVTYGEIVVTPYSPGGKFEIVKSGQALQIALDELREQQSFSTIDEFNSNNEKRSNVESTLILQDESGQILFFVQGDRVGSSQVSAESHNSFRNLIGAGFVGYEISFATRMSPSSRVTGQSVEPDDIFDPGSGSGAPVLFGLTSAFGTVDHEIQVTQFRIEAQADVRGFHSSSTNKNVQLLQVSGSVDYIGHSDSCSDSVFNTSLVLCNTEIHNAKKFISVFACTMVSATGSATHSFVDPNGSGFLTSIGSFTFRFNCPPQG